MENKELIKETVRYLDNISHRVGEKITEYDWREACGLILAWDIETNENNYVTQFFRNLDKLIACYSISTVLDFIFDTIDNLVLEHNQYDTVDKILAEVDCKKYSATVIIGFLTITNAITKDKLKNRQFLVNYVKSTFAEPLWQGLE